MKNLIKSAFAILLLSVMYSSCTYKKGELPKPTPVDTSKKVISYVKDIKPIMVMYCLGTGDQSCHTDNSNQGASTDFTIYDVIKSDIPSIQSRVTKPTGGAPMPPLNSNSPHPVPADTLAKLQKWIDAGAPNN